MKSQAFPDDVLKLSVLSMEAWVEEQGWDQLPAAYALVLTKDAGITEFPENDVGLGYRLLGEGDLYEVLSDIRLPRKTLGLMVTAEAWSFPTDLPDIERVGRPSEHPDRVEVRQATLMMKDGRLVTAMRERDEKPFADMGGGGGPICALMLEVLS